MPNIPSYMINSHFFFIIVMLIMMNLNYFLFSFPLPSKTSMIKSKSLPCSW